MEFSPDGSHIIAASNDGTSKIWNARTGKLRRALRISGRDVLGPKYDRDGSRVVSVIEGDFEHSVAVWSARSGRMLVQSDSSTDCCIPGAEFNPDGSRILVSLSRGGAALLDASSGRYYDRVRGVPGAVVVDGPPAAMKDQTFFATVDNHGLSIHHLDPEGRRSASIMLRSFIQPDGSFARLVYTADGLFTGDESAFDRIVYRLGNDLGEQVTVDQIFDYFYRPSLVEDFWAGRPLTLHPDVAAGVGKPPSVEILDVPAEPVDGDTIQIRVRAHSRGGGATRIRLFNNGARVPDTRERGMHRVTGRSTPAQEQQFTVVLAPGKNDLRAEAYSEVGLVRSPIARATVLHRGVASPPDLHLFAMSLENYADRAMTLDVAHDDAQAVIDAFERQAGRLFPRVHVHSLRDADATLEGVEQTLQRIAAAARPQDVFLMYMAGHGGMAACDEHEKREAYHLLTYRASLASRARMCREAISMERLTGLISKIPSNKKLLVLDACQSGSAAGAVSLLGMRGAQESEAIKRLARAQGLAILAGSKPDQTAHEARDLGHGMFTYALLLGLEGAAAPRDLDVVSVLSLVQYVDRRLDQLAREHGVEQHATYSSQGQDFSLYSFRPGEPPLVTVKNRAAVELSDAARRRIVEHLSSRKAMILACLDRGESLVLAEVQAGGQVLFSAPGLAPRSPEALCMQDAIPPITVEATGGTARVPLSLR